MYTFPGISLFLTGMILVIWGLFKLNTAIGMIGLGLWLIICGGIAAYGTWIAQNKKKGTHVTRPRVH